MKSRHKKRKCNLLCFRLAETEIDLTGDVKFIYITLYHNYRCDFGSQPHSISI